MAKVGDITTSFTLADAHDDFKQNVFDAGFWVGPVYVHVGVDVEFFFDAPLDGNVSMPKKNRVSGDLIEASVSPSPAIEPRDQSDNDLNAGEDRDELDQVVAKLNRGRKLEPHVDGDPCSRNPSREVENDLDWGCETCNQDLEPRHEHRLKTTGVVHFELRAAWTRVSGGVNAER